MVIDPVSGALIAVFGTAFDGLLQHGVGGIAHRADDRRRIRALAKPDRLVRRVADELVGLRRTELPGLSDQEWRRAVEAVRESLAAVRWAELAKAPADLVSAERLARRVPAADYELTVAGRAAYDLLLDGCCAGLAELARSVDRIMRDLQVGISDDVAELRGREEREAADFELRYADYVTRTTNSFELFGVARGRAPGRHSFDRSYISLAVARRTGAEEAPLTGAGVSAATAFDETRRVLLRGSAGSGKTTFLRWSALQAARQSPVGEVPFFVPLRQFAEGPLPSPEKLVLSTAPVLAEEKPERWVVARFREGRALLLVDGIDELGSERRAEAKQWLEELVAAYPEARYVVSTRPSAVDEDWLSEAEFTTFDLLPLSAKGVRDFLAAWHDAARGEQPDIAEWLNTCERSLAETLAVRADLRKLASSPLLCGLLCALHQDGGMHLPRDRKSLYDAALDLLLVRWDEQRGVAVDEDRFRFSKEEQLVVLQRFAYSLVRHSQQLVTKDKARQWIGGAMRGLRPHDAEPSDVLQRFLERTGLLRESVHGDVQFVHRTFRDYLAAKEVVDSGDLGPLVDHAHRDDWHDVVVMAVAHARPAERAEVLAGLLDGNEAARHDSRVADLLHLLAAASIEHADVVGRVDKRPDVRDEVRRAVSRLIPPTTMTDAETLASAGAFVRDLLPDTPDGLSDIEAACVVRAIAMIGGEGALEKIHPFAELDESVVLDELLRAWRNSPNPEDYARTVLAEVDFGDLRVDLRGWHRIRHVHYLRHLRHLRCLGGVTPLDPIAAMPGLRWLELMQNDVLRSLEPLSGNRSLRTLQLTQCPLVRDLSPIARGRVEELSLHFTHADLASLAGAGLRALRVRHPALERGLAVIPADLPLRLLAVDNRPPGRSLLGVERWPGLRVVECYGVPHPAELAELSELPNLERLVIRQPESPVELKGLADRVAVEVAA
ncbi:NACHT domain-containing protein [Actinosynnema sp. CS-041913]|uniref:NACHT domain-containing protein n=1 Tax=Actinosynnema sp. CS-041913 TaxID=3239917 RepID=UPI003D8F79C8